MDSERGVEAEGGTMVDTSSITGLVEVAKAMTEGDFHKTVNGELYGELGRLAEYIDKIRRNLQQLDDPLRDTSTKIPQAANQLSDVTETTERATHDILSLIEKILNNQEILLSQVDRLEMLRGEIGYNDNGMGEIIDVMKMVNAENQNDLIAILTSLSFQDLTGQKIQKIIGLVEQIETKVLEIIVTFGIKMEDRKALEGSDTDKEGLISQLQDTSKSIGLKQGLVDEILAGFGA